MELETVNKLYLELSQFATAKTKRELELEGLLRRLRGTLLAQSWYDRIDEVLGEGRERSEAVSDPAKGDWVCRKDTLLLPADGMCVEFECEGATYLGRFKSGCFRSSSGLFVETPQRITRWRPLSPPDDAKGAKP